MDRSADNIEARAGGVRGRLDAHTTALRVIAALLLFAAAYFLHSVLVPIALALVLAIALAPLADRIERLGLGRTLTSLVLVVLILGAALGVTALVTAQTGMVLQDTGRYLQRFQELGMSLAHRVGAEPTLKSLGYWPGETAADGGRVSGPRLLERSAQTLGTWIMQGLGGVVGAIAGFVLVLAFVFYMLQGRGSWIGRLKEAVARLGLNPPEEALHVIRAGIASYIGRLAMVSVVYAVVMSLVLWALGVPQPLLWGMLTGVLELVPYIGPVIAGGLPTLVALGSGGPGWLPLAVIGVFTALQTIEGYVVAPLLYGKAAEVDPVTALAGVLVFGFLWGPLGLALAMPMLILLRGILLVTPDTPALDALLDAHEAGSAPEAEPSFAD